MGVLVAINSGGVAGTTTRLNINDASDHDKQCEDEKGAGIAPAARHVKFTAAKIHIFILPEDEMPGKVTLTSR